MSLLNLPRAVVSRLAELRTVGGVVADEFRTLVEKVNVALNELDSDHRCRVPLYQVSGTGLTTTTATSYGLLWDKPPPWPGGDAYVGYDTGLLHANQNRFVPTKSGLYYVSAQIEWESGTSGPRIIWIAGFVGGSLRTLAQTSVVTTQATQIVSTIIPYDTAAQQSEFYNGNWSIHAYQASGGDLDVVKGDHTFAQVVRLR